MDYYDLYIQDPNPSHEPEPELDDSAGLESYSYAEEYSYPLSYLEHRQFLATSYLHQPWPWSWECECFLTSFSNGLFEQLNDTSWTLEPNDWHIPQTNDVPTARRLSCGSDGVGTVDPVEACAFELYADTLVDPYDVGERERVDDWLKQQTHFADESTNYDAESNCDSNVHEREVVSESSDSEYAAPSRARKRARTSKPSKGKVARKSKGKSLYRKRAPSPDDDVPAPQAEDVPVPQAAVDAAIAAGTQLPPNASLIPEKLQYMLLLGCVIVHVPGDKTAYLACKISPSCSEYGSPKRAPDMRRHMGTHFRHELEQPCMGCPLTFSRPDARKRHWNTKQECKYASEERKRAVLEFNALEEVEAVREADRQSNRKSTRKLEAMWTNFLQNAGL